MDRVRFGGTAMEVSPLCLGTWMFGTDYGQGEAVDRPTAHAILDAALDRGINFLDTANVYGQALEVADPHRPMPGRSERYIGEWLDGQDREDLVIASKVFYATRGRQGIGMSRKIVLSEIEGSLGRLGTDYLDIYYIHGWHEASPLEETLSAMNDLVRAGKVHYVGVSNFTSWQLLKAQWICDRNGWAPISVIQPRYNAADGVPYTVDPAELALPDLFDACRDQGIAVCPYAPLAGGFLSGRYRRDEDGDVVIPEGSRGAFTDRYGPFPERWWQVLEAVTEVAEELDATPAQVALRWTMQVEGLTSIPIVGGRKIDYLEDNVAALDLELSDEQHRRIGTAGAERVRGAYIYT